MSQSFDSHRLVIQHLSILESAAVIAFEVEKRVFVAIDEKIKKWVESRSDWEGVFDYLRETSFTPVSWPKNEKGRYSAYYNIAAETADGYEYGLSALIGGVANKYGIWFCVDTSSVTKLSGRAARPGAAWQRFVTGQFYESKLAKLGFQHVGESLFLPIQIDGQILADEYPALNDALAPIDEALKKLEEAHPEIDALLQAALHYQFEKPAQSA